MSIFHCQELTLIQVAAGRSLDFIAVFKPSRRADSRGDALAANKDREVLSCLNEVELEAVIVLLIANILGYKEEDVSAVKFQYE
jgi:hypothetical protein